MGVITWTAPGWARGSPASMLFAAGGRRALSSKVTGVAGATGGRQTVTPGGRISESARPGTWSKRRPAAIAQHARDDEGITVPPAKGDSTQLIPGLAIHSPEG